MFQIHFSDYGNTSTTYCYIRFNGRDPINQLHIATLCIKFSPLDNKLVAVSILENCLTAYPELHKAIQETLLPLLKEVHKNNAESIINTFMIIYTDIK